MSTRSIIICGILVFAAAVVEAHPEKRQKAGFFDQVKAFFDRNNRLKNMKEVRLSSSTYYSMWSEPNADQSTMNARGIVASKNSCSSLHQGVSNNPEPFESKNDGVFNQLTALECSELVKDIVHAVSKNSVETLNKNHTLVLRSAENTEAVIDLLLQKHECLPDQGAIVWLKKNGKTPLESAQIYNRMASNYKSFNDHQRRACAKAQINVSVSSSVSSSPSPIGSSSSSTPAIPRAVTFESFLKKHGIQKACSSSVLPESQCSPQREQDTDFETLSGVFRTSMKTPVISAIRRGSIRVGKEHTIRWEKHDLHPEEQLFSRTKELVPEEKTICWEKHDLKSEKKSFNRTKTLVLDAHMGSLLEQFKKNYEQ